MTCNVHTHTHIHTHTPIVYTNDWLGQDIPFYLFSVRTTYFPSLSLLVSFSHVTHCVMSKVLFLQDIITGAGPLDEWLSSCAPLQRPRVSPIWILGADMVPLVTLRRCPTWHNQRHSQLEHTTMYWGLWREEGKKKKRLAIDEKKDIITKEQGKGNETNFLLCVTLHLFQPLHVLKEVGS